MKTETQQFDPAIAKLKEELIANRRHLHQNPELSFHEVHTTEYILSRLKQINGLQVYTPVATGAVASVFGTKPGKKASVGIRADIDALPIQEDTGLSYASGNAGVMHACGHDGHTAILLATAEYLAAHRDQFCGEVRMIFQPAEELPPGGAIDMKRAGVDKGLDCMLALHLSSAFDTAVFGIRAGVLTAAVDRFDITVIGKGGHCAFPDLCIDPIVIGSEIVGALQTVVARKVKPSEPAVISVCQFHGGTAYNIIPNTITLTAAVRTFSKETRTLVETEVRRIAAGICQAHGAQAEVKWDAGYPSVINDAAMTATAREVLLQRFGPAHVLEIGPIMPGEDYSYFIDDKPGFFAELGTKNLALHTDYPHHNSKYRMDEEALLYGVQFFSDMCQKLLDGTGRNLPAEKK